MQTKENLRTPLKILLVEDDDGAIEACISSADVWNDDHPSQPVAIESAQSVDSAKGQLTDCLFDAIILDLSLENRSNDDGGQVLAFIKDNHRLPVAIYSGTPSSEIDERNIRIFTRGTHSYREVIEHLIALKQTPLYEVIGHNGHLDALIRKVFWERIANNPEFIADDGTHREDVDKDYILRQSIVHLQSLVTQTDTFQKPLDMYFAPFDEELRTGSILRPRQSNCDPHCKIVLSPPCDLVMRSSGHIKTPCVAICSIVPVDEFYENYIPDARTKNAIKSKLGKLINNNCVDYAHWLWPTQDFEGGLIDFRDVTSSAKQELLESYSVEPTAIQESYMKNILRRFSAFYARQGQPDIRLDDSLRDHLIEKIQQRCSNAEDPS